MLINNKQKYENKQNTTQEKTKREKPRYDIEILFMLWNKEKI